MDRSEVLEPGLRRLVAPNPSAMTERGTNTYILGTEELVVIDPGPDDPLHMQAILAAAAEAPIALILVTHAHLDHSALARPLAERTGAAVAAFGNCHAGRSHIMQGLQGIGGGEGLDHDFVPDRLVTGGSVVEGHGWRVEVMWTPGHLGNHLTFLWNEAAFCGDLVMAWSTSLVSPPDGDLARFMSSCRDLARCRPRILYPGHGAAIDKPQDRIAEILSHRERREEQILSEIAAASATPMEIACRIYGDLPAHLRPAAERNVLAHLIDLTTRSLIKPLAPHSPTTRYLSR